jgi:hypothetical protein
MDAEASTLVKGHRAGLYGYTAHCGSISRKFEDVWASRLAEILTDGGYPTAPQVAFPNQRRKKCDMVVQLPGRAPKKLWVEFKTAWKTWFNRWDDVLVAKNQFYLPYLFGPLRPGLRKTHSATQDIWKLQEFAPSGDALGFLLVGFDSAPSSMLPDVNAWVAEMELRKHGWRSLGPDVWADTCCGTCRTCSWYWWRAPAG